MTNGLRKILTELKAEKPRIDYVIGILETLIELDGTVAQIGRALPEPLLGRQEKVVGSTPTSSDEPKDEGDILTAQTKARIDAVKAMAEKSTEIA